MFDFRLALQFDTTWNISRDTSPLQVLRVNENMDITNANFCSSCIVVTVKTLNIGTPRPATVVVFNLKQFNFTMK